jgi:two-component system OmpR family response regulator
VTVRLLVVDDDPMLLEMIRRGLGGEGFAVETTTSPRSAGDAMKAFDPEIVLVDVNIPGMSDDDLGALVRAKGERARVLLFSAHDGSRLRALAARVGADGWVSKSSELADLAKQLRRIHDSPPGAAAKPGGVS